MISQTVPPLSASSNLLTMYDLPSENPEEPGLPDEFHFLEPILLFLTFIPANWSRELVYSASDMNLYYDIHHPLWYKRPDWFGVVGVPRLYEGKDLRLSYVTWQEKVNPFVVVELLSPGTEAEDLGETQTEPEQPPSKWEVYEKILRIPYYVVFSRYTNELQGFHLVANNYQSMNLDDGRLLIPELGLSLGVWQGSFEGIERLWLRWYNLEGDLIPIPEEQVQEAKQEAELAKQEAQEAKQEAELANRRAQRLAELLRELGINPDE